MDFHSIPKANRYTGIVPPRTAVEQATRTNRSSSETTSILTPTISRAEKPKPPSHAEVIEPPEPPTKNIPQSVPNPFAIAWALAKQYKEHCSLDMQDKNSLGNAFTNCRVLNTLWECCYAICEMKVTSSGAGPGSSMDETWSQLMVLVTELYLLLYPHDEDCYYNTTEAPPSDLMNVTLMALRMAIGRLVECEVPEVLSGWGYFKFRERFQLLQQLRMLYEYEEEPSNRWGYWVHSCEGVDLSKKDDAIIDALWFLLEAAFGAIEAQQGEKGGRRLKPEEHLKIQSRCEKEAYDACWNLCEALNAAFVASVWKEDSEFEVHSQRYSPQKKFINPSSSESSQDSQRHGSCESVSGWNRGVTTAQKELDRAGVADGNYSDNESTQTSSEASDSVTAGATTSSMPNVSCPEGVLRSPKSWDEDLFAPANVRSVSPETQIPKKTEQPPSSLPPKAAPPAAHVPTSTSASSPPQPKPPSTSASSPPQPKPSSSCARCSGIDTSDIEAIHHIRLRILILRAAIAKGYCPSGNRKFGDFVRDMPANAFGDTKAQKKLLNAYRAMLHSGDNIKAKGDTVAHEANLMQVKAAVEWKTQDGSYKFLKNLYKLVVGVEVEKVDTLSAQVKATLITG